VKGEPVRFAGAFEHLVEAGALVAVEFFRSLEHEMLQQVRRPRGPGHLVAGAHVMRDHECRDRRELLRQKQDAQAVGIEFVFHNVIRGADEGEAIGPRRGALCGEDGIGQQGDKELGRELHPGPFVWTPWCWGMQQPGDRNAALPWAEQRPAQQE